MGSNALGALGHARRRTLCQSGRGGDTRLHLRGRSEEEDEAERVLVVFDDGSWFHHEFVEAESRGRCLTPLSSGLRRTEEPFSYVKTDSHLSDDSWLPCRLYWFKRTDYI